VDTYSEADVNKTEKTNVQDILKQSLRISLKKLGRRRILDFALKHPEGRVIREVWAVKFVVPLSDHEVSIAIFKKLDDSSVDNLLADLQRTQSNGGQPWAAIPQASITFLHDNNPYRAFLAC
jgi:hypothetical protein